MRAGVPSLAASRPPLKAAGWQREQSSQSSLPSQAEESEGSSSSDAVDLEDNRRASGISHDEAGSAVDTHEASEDELDEEPPKMNGMVEAESQPTSQKQPEAEPERISPPKPPDLRPPAKPGSRTTAEGRRIEQLEAEVRLLAERREEDRQKQPDVEKLVADRNKFERIIQSLQAKYGPQSQELANVRAKLKEIESRSDDMEMLKAEHEEQMDMATVDRETAEEIAEQLRTELDALKQKMEDLELEIEVLREENEEYGKEMSPEERTSQGWLQMQRSNERMKEALLRLRDVTQDQEAELKDQLSALEEELRQLRDVQERFTAAKQQLERSEATVEDLKQQLDAALTAEEMVEELTESNNSLAEQLSQLKGEVDDLQTINELNDEFELQHQENEKQMQEEIDTRGAALSDQMIRAAQQEDKLKDYEYTIVKFRELVTSLQTHLEDMRASQQLTEAEAEELSSRSKAMTDLNIKLQTSAAKTQTTTIDLELRRMEAQEASEHLSIAQMFLPDSYKLERKSVLAYLRFSRVSFKSMLLQSVIKEKVSDFSSRQDESVFTWCDVLDKLAWISAMCGRFRADLGRCSMERFARYEGALQDLEPLERALSGYIEAYKHGDLHENQAADELKRSIAVLQHLGDSHFRDDGLAMFADDLLMRATLMQSNMETSAMALTCVRSMIASNEKATAQDVENDYGDDDDEEDNPLESYANQLDAAVARSRSVKVIAGKTLSSLTELQSRQSTLPQDVSEAFSEALDQTAAISRYAQALGVSVLATQDPEHDNDSKESRVRSALQAFHTHQFPEITNPSTPFSGLAQSIRYAYERVSDISKLASDTTNIEEFDLGPAPWIQRAQEIKSASATSLATESELSRLKDTMQDRNAQLRAQDQKVEEQNIKIELLESRAREAGERSRRTEELQRSVDGSKKREAELLRALEDASAQVDRLRDERDHMRSAVDAKQDAELTEAAAVGKRKSARAVATSHEVDALKLEIQSLQGAVRYLHTSKSEPVPAGGVLAEDHSWLDEPLFQLRKPVHKAAREQRDDLERDGNAVLDDLLHLAMNTKMVDLKLLPKDKLAWRPAKDKSSWLVARQQEQWEAWQRKSASFVTRARDFTGGSRAAMEGTGRKG